MVTSPSPADAFYMNMTMTIHHPTTQELSDLEGGQDLVNPSQKTIFYLRDGLKKKKVNGIFH